MRARSFGAVFSTLPVAGTRYDRPPLAGIIDSSMKPRRVRLEPSAARRQNKNERNRMEQGAATGLSCASSARQGRLAFACPVQAGALWRQRLSQLSRDLGCIRCNLWRSHAPSGNRNQQGQNCEG